MRISSWPFFQTMDQHSKLGLSKQGQWGQTIDWSRRRFYCFPSSYIPKQLQYGRPLISDYTQEHVIFTVNCSITFKWVRDDRGFIARSNLTNFFIWIWCFEERLGHFWSISVVRNKSVLHESDITPIVRHYGNFITIYNPIQYKSVCNLYLCGRSYATFFSSRTLYNFIPDVIKFAAPSTLHVFSSELS